MRTVESEIIPRLLMAHRPATDCLPIPDGRDGFSDADVEAFVKLVLAPDEGLGAGCVRLMVARGVPAARICQDLLAPVARRLGELWAQDRCAFTDVTFGVGRLHHILRELGPRMDQGPERPANGLRVLLMPAPGEQHTFGVLMVAEFFRSEGWHVELALPEDGSDPVKALRGEWFDVIGFSVSCESRLGALRECISRVRKASVNPGVCIMAGGALVANHPTHAQYLGADMAPADGRSAPAAAERLVAARADKSRRSESRSPPTESRNVAGNTGSYGSQFQRS